MKRAFLFRIIVVVSMVIFGTVNEVKANELRYLAVGYPPQVLDYIQEAVVVEFEKQHGIKVVVDAVSWADRREKITVSILAGLPYDVVDTGYYSPYEEGSLGLLAELNNHIDGWDKKNRFPQPLWLASQWEGKVYHVPKEIDLRGIAYNKGLFAEAGFDPDDPPADSWESLNQVAKQLTRLENDMVSLQGYFTYSGAGDLAKDLFWFMAQAGVPEVDVSRFVSNLDTQEATEALRFLMELAESGGANLPKLQYGQFHDRLAAMQRFNIAGMVGLLDVNRELLVNEFGAFLPRRDMQSQPVSHAYINGYAILEASKMKDLAWEFISAMHDDNVRFELERRSGFFSGRMDLIEDLAAAIPNIEYYYDFLSYLHASVVPPSINTAIAAQDELGMLLRQAHDLKLSPENALIQSHEMWNRLLKDWETEIRK